MGIICNSNYYNVTNDCVSPTKTIQNTQYNIGIMLNSGNQSQDVNSNPVEEQQNNTITSTQQENEETVKNILTEAGVEFDENIVRQVAKKYPTMQAIPQAGLTIEERVINYAKGLIFSSFGLSAAQVNETGDYQSDCSKAKSIDELKDAYKQFGAEYVETFDQDNDGKINVYEMFYQELISNYIDNGSTEKDAKTRALKVTKDFENKKYNALNLPTESTLESILFGEVAHKIAMHEASGEVPDFAMSATEAGTHLLSMAQLTDSKNNITGMEYRGATYAIMYSDYSLEEIMAEGHSEEEAKGILSCVKKYEQNLGKAKALLTP